MSDDRDIDRSRWEAAGRPRGKALDPIALLAREGDPEALEVVMVGLDRLLRRACIRRARVLSLPVGHPRWEDFVDELLGDAREMALVCLRAWDPAKASLVTYVHASVSTALIRRAKSHMNLVRVPEYVHDRRRRDTPESEERYSRAIRPARSLDRDRVGDRPYYEVLSAARPPAAEERLDSEVLVEGALRLLRPREALAVRLVFGIGRAAGATLEEAGREMRCSREMVRRYVKRGLARLRSKRLFREYAEGA